MTLLIVGWTIAVLGILCTVFALMFMAWQWFDGTEWMDRFFEWLV